MGETVMGDKDSFDDFGSDSDFNDFGDGFGDDSSFDLDDNSNNNEDNKFDAVMNNNQQNTADGNQFNDQQNPATAVSSNKKLAVIMILAGVLIIIAVLIVASIIVKNKNSSKSNITMSTETYTSAHQNQQNEYTQTQQDQSQQDQSQQASESTVSDGWNEWTEVSNSEQVTFDDQPIDSQFTVTDKKSYARVANASNSLIMKTVLTGTIDGVSGTYTLEVPYSLGTKLERGQTFTVKVYMGTYVGEDGSSRVVVGGIRY